MCIMENEKTTNWTKAIKFIIDLLKLVLTAFLGASGANLLG